MGVQTKIRHVRAGEEWEAAADRANSEGMTVSAAVRALLRDYANGHIDIIRR